MIGDGAGEDMRITWLPRAKNARDKVRGALPRTPARGIPPETPGPLSLQLYLPERSSPSRVRSGKSFQKPKRFSSAAQKPRALDRCGPFRRYDHDKGKGANAKATTLALANLRRLPWVGHWPQQRLRIKSTKEAWRRSFAPPPGSSFD